MFEFKVFCFVNMVFTNYTQDIIRVKKTSLTEILHSWWNTRSKEAEIRSQKRLVTEVE